MHSPNAFAEAPVTGPPRSRWLRRSCRMNVEAQSLPVSAGAGRSAEAAPLQMTQRGPDIHTGCRPVMSTADAYCLPTDCAGATDWAAAGVSPTDAPCRTVCFAHHPHQEVCISVCGHFKPDDLGDGGHRCAVITVGFDQGDDSTVDAFRNAIWVNTLRVMRQPGIT